MREIHDYTDPELVTLLMEGDRDAYAAIYHRYSLSMLNHAYYKTRSREDARDCVHEVFAQLWCKRSQLKPIDNLSGFLFISLRNYILNQIAHKSVQDKYIASMLQFAAGEAIVADHLVREKQLMALIEKEIASLPPKMREVFELSRKHHLSHAQIADRLAISEQTVSKHITNALKILRARLGIFLYLLWINHP